MLIMLDIKFQDEGTRSLSYTTSALPSEFLQLSFASAIETVTVDIAILSFFFYFVQ